MSKFRKRLVDDAGFTLIELLVVIAVLGILAGIAVPRITGVQDEARKSTVNATAQVIRNSFEQYYALEGSYPSGSSINDALGGGDTDLSIDIDSDELDVTLDSSGGSSYKVTVEHSDDSSISATITEGGISKAE